MTYFFDSVETIEPGHGFTYYDSLHLSWLALFVVATVFSCIWYNKMSDPAKKRWKKIVATCIIIIELCKYVFRLSTGTFVLEDLPFHLCGLNIFMIAINAWKPNKTVNNFLYFTCIPGALAALLFPDWYALPLGNYMHLHSFIIHILLTMYPIVLLVNGELKPSIKDMPKALLLLLILAVLVFGLNQLWDSNYMFMSYVEDGNPLQIFENLWGNHLYGYPIVVAAVLLVMYGPLELVHKLRKNRN